MIAILTPSRGRPERFAEMVAAIERTAWQPVNVYLGLDEDDADHYDVPAGVRCLIRPRMHLAPWTNVLAEQALADGATILGSFGDDHRPRTTGWDDSVERAFASMGSGLVYTRDGLQDERLPTAPFWSADIIRTLGWFFPPALEHLYADDYWLALANDLERRTYLPDVLLEHLHPSAGKAEVDEINESNDAMYDADREAFVEFMRTEHPSVVDRLRPILTEPDPGEIYVDQDLTHWQPRGD